MKASSEKIAPTNIVRKGCICFSYLPLSPGFGDLLPVKRAGASNLYLERSSGTMLEAIKVPQRT